MGRRIENNFTQVHEQMDEPRCDFKQQMDGVKESVREIEKSLEFAWAAIKESKAFKESKKSYQEMLDKQTNLIQQLQSEVKNVRDENEKNYDFR